LNGNLNVTDIATINGLNVTNNTSLRLLNVTNATQLASLTVSDFATLSSTLNVIGDTNVSLLTVTGLSNYNSLATFNQGATVANGLTANQLTITTDGTVGGSLTVATLFYNRLSQISGFSTYTDVASFIMKDFTGNISNASNTSLVTYPDTYLDLISNATFGGRGYTTINNKFLLNTSSIQIVGSGTTTGIQYTGPFDIIATSNTTGFNYVGPVNISTSTTATTTSSNISYNGNVDLLGKFNLSTTTTGNSIKYEGNLTLSGDLRIKSGYNLFIEGTNTMTQINTSTLISNILKITNNGTGPGLIVNQTDSNLNDIVWYQDSSINVFTIADSGNTTIVGKLKVGYTYTTPFSTYNNTIVDINGSCSVGNDLLVTGNVISQSDRRIKTNIKLIDECLNKIENMNGYVYNRSDLNNERHIGLIAQEVEEFFPELVTETNNIKGINYQGFVGILLNCIKELNQKIENMIKI
jgi:hypothetical protein